MNPAFGPGAGALCALGSGFTWAITSLLVRILAPSFNSATINAIRTTIGGALLLALVLLSGEIASLTSVSGAALLLLAASTVAGFGVGDTAFFESTQRLGLARAMTVSMIYPMIATLLATLFLRERITARFVAGSLLTLGGLALIVARRHDDGAAEEGFWLGIGTAILAALGWATGATLLKPALRELDAITAQAIRLPFAGAFLWTVPWTWGALGRLRESHALTLRRLVALGALTAVSSGLFVAAVKYAGVSVSTVLSSTSPLFAIPLGYIFLGERPTPGAVAGSILTIAGIAVLQL